MIFVIFGTHNQDFARLAIAVDEFAELLIMQGGWGTIEEALDLGKKIVAVPRIHGPEHVHNQEQLVRKLESLGCLTGCYDAEKLAGCIEIARKTKYSGLTKGSAFDEISKKLDIWFN
jgi:UDP-N-acetylglucosamine transferase subunit ALG13